jgi:hypothetical protein
MLIALAHGTPLAASSPNVSPEHHFKYTRYDAEGGALYNSNERNAEYNNSARAILVDSKGQVWVSTVTGLTVYDGKHWRSRTFKSKGVTARAVFGLLALTDCGPEAIVEGPPGTIWFGGQFGIWRYRDGHYEEVSSEITSQRGMAVDHSGALWVVTKYDVQRYDGKTWNTVLCPYFTDSIHRELPGLFGITVSTNGSTWVGGNAYVEPKAPWTYEGTTWVVDQSKKQRNGGPPMAPLFEFNGKHWRAFGAPHGLSATKREWAVPELDGFGRIVARTPKGYYRLEGDVWKPTDHSDIVRDKRWVLRERKKGLLRGYSQLLFRDGEKLIDVRPRDHKTGQVLDISSEQLVSVRFAEDPRRSCVWLGTQHGLYRIWREEQER